MADVGTIDWCESNFVVLGNVAEFWNTISSLACAVPPLFWFFSPTPSESGVLPWFHLLLSFIFVGSAAFHGTLTFTGQLLDEVPILALLICSLSVLVDNLSLLDKRGGLVRRSWWAPGPRILAVFCFLQVCLLTFVYAAHHKIYAFFIGFALFQAALHWPLIFYALHNQLHWDGNVLHLLAKHVGFGYSAYGLWCLEHAYCDDLRSLNLHSIWHFGACLGMKPFIDLLIYHRLRALGFPVKYSPQRLGFGASIFLAE